MSENWMQALRNRERVRLRWGASAVTGVEPETRAMGRIISYSDMPMVCVLTDSGEQIWWAAELAEVVNPENRRESHGNGPLAGAGVEMDRECHRCDSRPSEGEIR